MVDALLDFIARDPGSADETRSSAIARLYELRAPLVLDRLAPRPEGDQKVIVRDIAWGLANNFHPFIDLHNFQRLAVGAHWEVVKSSYPHRAISKRIEEELRQVLEQSASVSLPKQALERTGRRPLNHSRVPLSAGRSTPGRWAGE
jgi:hypothetical protein